MKRGKVYSYSGVHILIHFLLTSYIEKNIIKAIQTETNIAHPNNLIDILLNSMEVKLATEIITKPILKHYFRNLRLKHASPAVVQGEKIQL